MKAFTFILLGIWALMPMVNHAQDRAKSTAVKLDGAILYVETHSLKYSVKKQNFSEQQVLAIGVDDTDPANPPYVFTEFETKHDGPFKVDFFLKIVSVFGNVDAELQYFDPINATFQTWSRFTINREKKFTPSNWAKYALSYDTVGHKNRKGDAYRIVFFFGDDSLKNMNHGGGNNGKNGYFLTDIRCVALASEIIANSGFEEWRTDQWPAKPISWELSRGSGCIERSRGHLLDDYALTIINSGNTAMEIVGSTAILLKAKKYRLDFFARSEKKGFKIKLSMPSMKISKTFRLGEKWDRYSFTFRSDDVATVLHLISEGPGSYSVDEVSIVAL